MTRAKEQIKARVRQGTHPSTSIDWRCLNEEHVLGPARCVNLRQLRFHLLIDHGIAVKDCKTPLELGKLHLLAHALIVHPELRELIGGNVLKWEYR